MSSKYFRMTWKVFVLLLLFISSFVLCVFLIYSGLEISNFWKNNNEDNVNSAINSHFGTHQFGDDHYECFGRCFCDNNGVSERRRISHASKSLRYIFAAISLPIAFETSMKHFQKECVERFSSSCGTNNENSQIISEVDSCEYVSFSVNEKVQSKTTKKEKQGAPVADKLDELLEVFTPDGVGTGVSEKRGVIHREGIWHSTVHCWITDKNGNLLVSKRSVQKVSYPGMYDLSAGGHIPFGYTPLEAAIMETEEELGLEIAPEDCTPCGVYKRETPIPLRKGGETIMLMDRVHIFCYIVELKEIDLKKIKMQEEEVEEVSLVRWNEFRERIDSGDSQYVKREYYDDVWGKLEEKY